MKSLTPKQRRFVDEYLVDRNAAAAARRAGYAPKRADQIGHENLRKPEIAAAIREVVARQTEFTQLKADQALGWLGLIAHTGMDEFVEISEEGEVKLSLNNVPKEKLRAVKKLTQDVVQVPTPGGTKERVRRTTLELVDPVRSLMTFIKVCRMGQEQKAKARAESMGDAEYAVEDEVAGARHQLALAQELKEEAMLHGHDSEPVLAFIEEVLAAPVRRFLLEFEAGQATTG